MSDEAYNEALVRLVKAVKPSASREEETSSVDLAHRLIESQLGGGAPLEGAPQQFASTWKRRIHSQQMSQGSSQAIEQLYQDLSHAVALQGPNDEDLPTKILTVLTKCIGNAKTLNNLNAVPNQASSMSDPTRMTTEPLPSSTANQMEDALRYEEQEVLRELLYALQGIEGERIKFYFPEEHKDIEAVSDRPNYEGIRVLSPALYPDKFQFESHNRHQSSLLGSGAMDALRICGEAGWLCKRLQRFVDFHLSMIHQQPQHMLAKGGGRIARALARAVSNELQHYYDTLSQWERHLPNWSLRQWLVQIQRHSVLQRLTVLAMITEAVPTGMGGNGVGVGGGILLSALYKHSLHGDLRHKSLVQSILYPTSQPWFHMLYLWTTQGSLPASWGGDFFVTLQQGYVNGMHNLHGTSHPSQSSGDNKHLWHDKYTLDKALIPHPGIFDRELIRPAFVIGKGINFIQTCLNQVGWTLQLDDPHQGDAKMTDQTLAASEENKTEDSEHTKMEKLGYHYVANPVGMHHNPRLTQTLLRAERLVHTHILQSLRQDHNLLDHLFALKQFLFHGQGDFFSSLLEGLYVEFGCGTKAANPNTSFVTGHTVAGVYPSQLLAIMETSLRSTNAKDLPTFCLERLEVEMLPFQPNQGSSIGQGLFASPTRHGGEGNEPAPTEDNRTVWDIFLLNYKVPDPLIAIIHKKAMDQYKLVYSFLFGLRKVEYMLNRTWRQSATLQHQLQMMAQNNGLQTSSSVGYAHATILLRKIAMTRQAMTHFCVNLKSYCMLEVLEGGWKELLEQLEQARTLDEAIHAHDSYLEGICRKTLLLKGNIANRAGNARGRGGNNKFRYLFGVLLSIATEFCILQERLFDEALEAAERVAQRRREAEQRMTHGQWGFENEQDLAEEESFFGLANASELEQVVKLSEGFHQCMQSFLEALDAKVNGRSRNMSTSMDGTFDDDLSDAEDGGDPSKPMFAEAPGEEQDIDALRFLVLQLDHNHYYGLLQRN